MTRPLSPTQLAANLAERIRRREMAKALAWLQAHKTEHDINHVHADATAIVAQRTPGRYATRVLRAEFLAADEILTGVRKVELVHWEADNQGRFVVVRSVAELRREVERWAGKVAA